jgi:hypothetical protein
MKYNLRSLIFVLMLAPPLLAAAWFGLKNIQRVQQPHLIWPAPHDSNDTLSDQEWMDALRDGHIKWPPATPGGEREKGVRLQ